jgi:hypothetical protein
MCGKVNPSEGEPQRKRVRNGRKSHVVDPKPV